MFILNSCSKLMSKPNNDLYREFCKDFKNNKKSQIKTLTYTELEDSVIYNLINNDLDLDEEKKKIEYSVEYTTNMTYIITLFSLIPTFLGLILPILCATTEKLDLDLAFSLVGIILVFWTFYIFSVVPLII